MQNDVGAQFLVGQIVVLQEVTIEKMAKRSVAYVVQESAESG